MLDAKIEISYFSETKTLSFCLQITCIGQRPNKRQLTQAQDTICNRAETWQIKIGNRNRQYIYRQTVFCL